MNKKVIKLSLTAAMTSSMVFSTVMVNLPVVYAQSVIEGTPITYAPATVASLTDIINANINDWYDQGDLRVTKLQEGIFHIDEGTAAHPAIGATNNASSMYLIVDGDEAILIDAGNGSTLDAPEQDDDMKIILQQLVGSKDFSIYLTHWHPDHVGFLGISGVFAPSTEVYVHEDDYSDLFDEIKTTYQMRTFKEGDVLGTPNHQLTVVDITGHTEGSNALIDYDNEVVFTGDALGSATVWLFAEDDLIQYEQGVANIYDAIKDMDNPILYCGHRYQQGSASSHASGEIAVGEVGKQYVLEMMALIEDIKMEDYHINPDYPVAWGDAMYSDSDLNDDGIVPGIFAAPVVTEGFWDKYRVFQDNGAIVEYGDTGVLIVDGTEAGLSEELQTKIGDRDVYEVSSSEMPDLDVYELGDATVVPVLVTGADTQSAIGYSDAIGDIIDVADRVIYMDTDNMLELTGIETGTPESPLELTDNNPTTGASYYNMMAAYSKAYQANPMGLAEFGTDLAQLGEFETVYTPSAVVDRDYLDDLATIFDKINNFDQSLNLSLAPGAVSIDLVASEGSAKLDFHVQTNGYWGYALAGDSIINQVFGVDGGYMENMATQTAKGNFFKIDYGNGIYVLRDTDLQNPILIMNDSEALLIDTDNYGSEVFHDYIMEAVGDRDLSVYITHVHGDHLINLQYLDPSEVTTLYYPEGEPTSGPTAGGVNVEDILSPFAAKTHYVSDGEILNVAGKEFEVIAMTGHTAGGTQLLDKTDRILFSGDTLGAQTFKGGTRVGMTTVDLWLDQIQANIDRLGVGTPEVRYDFIIGGHIPYKVVPEYELWMQTALQAAKENAMAAATAAPSGTIVVVKDGVLQTSQQILDLFANPISDDAATRFASITLNEDRKDLNEAVISYDDEFTYDGTAHEPEVAVVYDDVTLVEGVDFTVAYSNNVEVGEATVSVTGIGSYRETVEGTFTILAAANQDDETSESTAAEVVDTGDHTNPLLATMAMIGSLVILAAVTLKKRIIKN